MYKMKSDINFSLTHEMLENEENERIHTSYAQEKAILECVSNGDIHALENTYYSLPTTVYGKMTSSKANVTFTKVAASATTYNDSQIPALTALSNIKQQVAVSKVTRINSVAVQVDAAMENSALTTGYYMNSIGLYANDPDDGEILYAVAGANVGAYMPPYNGITVSGAYLKLVTTVSNASNVASIANAKDSL